MECSQVWIFVLQTAVQNPTFYKHSSKYSTNLDKDIYMQGKTQVKLEGYYITKIKDLWKKRTSREIGELWESWVRTF
jgi:NAD+--asparagine ADP-ribosyltransferase